jgi:hypothetical protein
MAICVQEGAHVPSSAVSNLMKKHGRLLHTARLRSLMLNVCVCCGEFLVGSLASSVCFLAGDCTWLRDFFTALRCSSPL